MEKGAKPWPIGGNSNVIAPLGAPTLLSASGNGLKRRRYNRLIGFTGVPFTQTSKCKCGPVLQPVEPTAAMR